jgi:hypothetical protein
MEIKINKSSIELNNKCQNCGFERFEEPTYEFVSGTLARDHNMPPLHAVFIFCVNCGFVSTFLDPKKY